MQQSTGVRFRKSNRLCGMHGAAFRESWTEKNGWSLAAESVIGLSK
jgi:hypothetical protein